jgi:hypothetical protein
VKRKLNEEVFPKYWEMDEWLIYWINFYSSFFAIYHTHMKYCESKKYIEKNLEFGSLQIEEKQVLRYIWDKRRRKEREYWKGFWDRMEACFGENV